MKGALEELDKVRAERKQVLDEGVQKCQNYNCVEDLMNVHTSQAEKGTVFEKHTSDFKQNYAPLEALDRRQAEVMNIITQNMGAFTQLLSSQQGDTAKQQFYQQLDQAIGFYGELMNMLHQGSQFYTQLSDHLTKLFQK